MSPLPRLLALALCFFLGTILGQVAAGRVPSEAVEELTAYLRSYVTLETSCSPQVVLSALVLYLRYPLLAVLLGFASVGVVLLPCVTAAYGFFLSFSVCCFTMAFGTEGVLLALAVFGLRCAVTMPCYFLLAVPAWQTAAGLAAASFGGRGRRREPIVYGPPWRRRVAVCTAVLLSGMCVDLYLSPWLLRQALERALGLLT